MTDNSNNEFFSGILRVTDIDEANLKDFIINKIENKEKISCVFLNSSMIVKAVTSKKYRNFINSCDLIIPETPAVLSAAKKAGYKEPALYSQFQFTVGALAAAESKSGSAFITGGNSVTIKKAYNNLCTTFPALKVVGMCRGNYTPEEEKSTVLAIKKSSPSILIAGTSIPGGNKWCTKYKNEFNPGIYIYTPETFEIMAGQKENKKKAGTSAAASMTKYFLFPHLWIKGMILAHFILSAGRFHKKQKESKN